MNVSNEIKQAFANTSNPRVLEVFFPNIGVSGLLVDMEHIIQESLSVKESILENDSIEFVGCVASELTIELYGVREELKGEIVEVKIKVRTSEEPETYTDPIRIFYGRVDSVELEANHNKRKITAYDMLYSAGNIEVADWYNGLNFNAHGGKGLTLGEIRHSLFGYINGILRLTTGVQIEQKYVELPNDEGFYIKKQYNPTTLRSIDVIKSICQINGVFGIINREITHDILGDKVFFEYRVLTEITDDPTIPGETLFTPFIPGIVTSSGDEKPSHYIQYYRSIDYQEYTVKPVDKITIRDSEDKKGVSYGDGDNNYIIQGNIFTYKLSDNTVRKIAENIYPYICDIVYRPFESSNDGSPWIECGEDVVTYLQYDYEQSTPEHDVYSMHKYYVFNRNMTGIQALKDEYTATGEQDQRQFLTDVNARIETIKKTTQEVEVDLSDYYTKEEIVDNYYDKEYIDNLDPGENGWSVQSVPKLPTQGKEKILYLIQGEVVVE